MLFWPSQINTRDMNIGKHLLWCHYLDWSLRTPTDRSGPSIHTELWLINTQNERMEVTVETGCSVWSWSDLEYLSGALSHRSLPRHPNERQNVTAAERMAKHKKLQIYSHLVCIRSSSFCLQRHQFLREGLRERDNSFCLFGKLRPFVEQFVFKQMNSDIHS